MSIKHISFNAYTKMTESVQMKYCFYMTNTLFKNSKSELGDYGVDLSSAKIEYVDERDTVAVTIISSEPDDMAVINTILIKKVGYINAVVVKTSAKLPHETGESIYPKRR